MTFAPEQMNAATHRKHHDNIFFPLNHNSQIEPHFEAPKSLMDEDILYDICGDESCRGRGQIARTTGTGLYAQAADDE